MSPHPPSFHFASHVVRPLTEADAPRILAWCYEPPYHIYNIGHPELSPADRAAQIAFLLDPRNHYFAVDDGEGRLLGYCCFGADARVPGYDYSRLDALDVGLGMDPARTGRGAGRAFLAAILAFARRRFQPLHVRATVALFNLRSQRTFRRAGFTEVATFTRAPSSSQATPLEFVVLTAPTSGSGDPPPAQSEQDATLRRSP